MNRKKKITDLLKYNSRKLNNLLNLTKNCYRNITKTLAK